MRNARPATHTSAPPAACARGIVTRTLAQTVLTDRAVRRVLPLQRFRIGRLSSVDAANEVRQHTTARVRCSAAALAFAAQLLAACATVPPTNDDSPLSSSVGPARGSLVIVGGGRVGPEIMSRFIALAGGVNARIVILPGAGTEDSFPDDWAGYRSFRDAGVQHVAVLHTRDRAEADAEAFVAPLVNATGVWIPGGRQWRLADTYLGTRTLRELHALLDRGGVIGGTSAGASIQASYMVRGAVEGNQIMMAPGHEEGFGFLQDAAVDQHLSARGRQEDMLQVVERYHHLLGIGIDESTAIVVERDRAEVIGRGRVAFYNTRDAGDLRYYFLEPGDVFDLASRRTISGQRIAPERVRDEQEVIRTVTQLFDAMRRQDTAAIRSITHPELRLFVPQGQGTNTLRVSTIDQFVRSVAQAQARFDERAYDPTVHVDGPLAAVWTYYEFWNGDSFSHCGTDAFHLARTAEQWQIIALAYTIQREGCRRVPRGG